jgi:4-azaleucine resistance transporter AzlC
MRQSLPLVVSDFAIGLVFGVLARQAGLSLMRALLMSGLVFGGGSLFVTLSLWVAPLPVVAIILTTLVVNMRYLLMGAALFPWDTQLPLLKRYACVFFMVDESWALAMSEFASGGRDSAFLPGSGLVLFLAWVSATIIGQTVGAANQNPAR